MIDAIIIFTALKGDYTDSLCFTPNKYVVSFSLVASSSIICNSSLLSSSGKIVSTSSSSEIPNGESNSLAL